MNRVLYVGRVAIGVAFWWTALYTPLVFLTTFWAGGRFSPTQGGAHRS